MEIAKAISLDARVLIMDEPTASLSAHEVDRLFDQVTGCATEASPCCSSATASTRCSASPTGSPCSATAGTSRPDSTAETNHELLVREMVGRDIDDFFVRTRHEPGETALRVEGLGRAGTFEDVNFEVRAGEVVGFAGLVGAGRTDVGLALFGIAPAERGTISSTARRCEIRSPRDAMRLGIAYLSEDRRRLGLSMPQSVASNITLPAIGSYRTPFGLLDRRAEEAVGRRASAIG